MPFGFVGCAILSSCTIDTFVSGSIVCAVTTDRYIFVQFDYVCPEPLCFGKGGRDGEKSKWNTQKRSRSRGFGVLGRNSVAFSSSSSGMLVREHADRFVSFMLCSFRL